VAFNVGSSLAAGACSASINMAVTVTTTDATLPIVEIGDAFANNNIGVPITDQSGDNVPNAGDGNANFDEGSQPGNSDGNGVPKQTGLQAQGAVLLGSLGQPAATGPNSNNDDFTNRSLTTGIGNVAPGGITTAAGTLVFANTVQNSGNANDTFALTVPQYLLVSRSRSASTAALPIRRCNRAMAASVCRSRLALPRTS